MVGPHVVALSPGVVPAHVTVAVTERSVPQAPGGLLSFTAGLAVPSPG